MQRSLKVFLVCAGLWQIAVGVIYGLFIGYSQSSFTAMISTSANNFYYYASDTTTFTRFTTNSTAYPFPQFVTALAMILLIVGLAMVAGYYERASISSMAFTLLLFALTVQNFFIFRDFWDKASLNDPNASSSFSIRDYNRVNSINFGNSLQTASGATTNYAYTSASFLDAVGAALALYAGFSAVVGRIGLGQVFFLSWVGTFCYELNSQILWRLYIPDNGFASRAFAFGGMLGIVSSLLLGRRELTVHNENAKNGYYLRTLAFLGVIFVWCCYPVLVLATTFTSAAGQIVAMSGQVNIWLALAGSAIGCYLASSYLHRKFCVHDMVFSSFTGAIAFSSSTDINYNPGAAIAIGTAVGFICCLGQSRLKGKMNSNGVIDTNGTLFQFLVPSLFAAIFSAILSGVGQSSATFTTASNTLITYTDLKEASRSAQRQGGFQMAGWLISAGVGAVAGLIIGAIYAAIDQRDKAEEFFADSYFFGPAGPSNQAEEGKRASLE